MPEERFFARRPLGVWMCLSVPFVKQMQVVGESAAGHRARSEEQEVALRRNSFGV